MAFLNWFIIAFAASSFTVVTPAKSFLANHITLCDQNSPKLNECVKEATNKLIPQLKDGVREIGFPPLDPFHIPKMDIGQEKGTVYLKLELSDTVHYGFQHMKIDSVNMDMKNLVWEFNASLPKYTLTGNYIGKGRILLLPLGGAGTSNFTLLDMKTHLIITGGKKMMGGVEHFDVKNTKVTTEFAPGKNFMDIRRLKGDLTLAETTRKFLSENADEVIMSMRKTFEDVYTDIYTTLLRRFFDKVPYSDLFKKS